MPRIPFLPNPFSPSSSSSAKKPTPATVLFQDYYAEWFKTLKSTLLPLIHRSLSDPSPPALLSSHVQLLLHHFLSYYDALDLAATVSAADNLPHLLYPSWRNPLERPFLFLGDLHPYLLTNLLRKFLAEDDNNNNGAAEQLRDKDDAWQMGMAWKDPSQGLIVKIEQIERGLRLIVPSFSERARKAQLEFMKRVGEQWGAEKSAAAVGEAMKAEMDDLVSVFVDANRLRRSVISEIVGTLDLYQGAMFLEGLALFLVGFKDPDLVRKFRRHTIAPAAADDDIHDVVSRGSAEV